MVFQPVTYNDLDEIRNLQPPDWSDIIPDFRFYLETKYCHPIKMETDGRIVGVAASIILGNTAWLAHIIVDINYRRQGIGYALVQELINSQENRSVKSFSLIATELGQPVYAKAGFKVAAEYVFLKRENPWPDQTVASQVVPFLEAYRSGIYELDREISGENRIVLLKDCLQNSMVYIRNKDVLGFYLPDLKEGLIYADTGEAGLELMKVKFAKIDKAALPSDNMTGISFLKQNGFGITEKKGTRMFLGNEINWQPRKIYSRIGGNLG
jgi:N-acetylglutamate synthase-like GNAT family acetyltransferase